MTIFSDFYSNIDWHTELSNQVLVPFPKETLNIGSPIFSRVLIRKNSDLQKKTLADLLKNTVQSKDKKLLLGSSSTTHNMKFNQLVKYNETFLIDDVFKNDTKKLPGAPPYSQLRTQFSKTVLSRYIQNLFFNEVKTSLTYEKSELVSSYLADPFVDDTTVFRPNIYSFVPIEQFTIENSQTFRYAQVERFAPATDPVLDKLSSKEILDLAPVSRDIVEIPSTSTQPTRPRDRLNRGAKMPFSESTSNLIKQPVCLERSDESQPQNEWKEDQPGGKKIGPNEFYSEWLLKITSYATYPTIETSSCKLLRAEQGFDYVFRTSFANTCDSIYNQIPNYSKVDLTENSPPSKKGGAPDVGNRWWKFETNKGWFYHENTQRSYDFGPRPTNIPHFKEKISSYYNGSSNSAVYRYYDHPTGWWVFHLKPQTRFYYDDALGCWFDKKDILPFYIKSTKKLSNKEYKSIEFNPYQYASFTPEAPPYLDRFHFKYYVKNWVYNVRQMHFEEIDPKWWAQQHDKKWLMRHSKKIAYGDRVPLHLHERGMIFYDRKIDLRDSKKWWKIESPNGHFYNEHTKRCYFYGPKVRGFGPSQTGYHYIEKSQSSGRFLNLGKGWWKMHLKPGLWYYDDSLGTWFEAMDCPYTDEYSPLPLAYRDVKDIILKGSDGNYLYPNNSDKELKLYFSDNLKCKNYEIKGLKPHKNRNYINKVSRERILFGEKIDIFQDGWWEIQGEDGWFYSEKAQQYYDFGPEPKLGNNNRLRTGFYNIGKTGNSFCYEDEKTGKWRFYAKPGEWFYHNLFGRWYRINKEQAQEFYWGFSSQLLHKCNYAGFGRIGIIKKTDFSVRHLEKASFLSANWPNDIDDYGEKKDQNPLTAKKEIYDVTGYNNDLNNYKKILKQKGLQDEIFQSSGYVDDDVRDCSNFDHLAGYGLVTQFENGEEYFTAKDFRSRDVALFSGKSLRRDINILRSICLRSVKKTPKKKNFIEREIEVAERSRIWYKNKVITNELIYNKDITNELIYSQRLPKPEREAKHIKYKITPTSVIKYKGIDYDRFPVEGLMLTTHNPDIVYEPGYSIMRFNYDPHLKTIKLNPILLEAVSLDGSDYEIVRFLSRRRIEAYRGLIRRYIPEVYLISNKIIEEKIIRDHRYKSNIVEFTSRFPFKQKDLCMTRLYVTNFDLLTWGHPITSSIKEDVQNAYKKHRHYLKEHNNYFKFEELLEDSVKFRVFDTLFQPDKEELILSAIERADNIDTI